MPCVSNGRENELAPLLSRFLCNKRGLVVMGEAAVQMPLRMAGSADTTQSQLLPVFAAVAANAACCYLLYSEACLL